jgi:3-deoxy-D-manno-octulosonate 8-phosphate phosphatase KdsC-like HAD superfamily phosphatase
MPGYYAYFIALDGCISKRVALVSDDDEEAKRFAKQMLDGHAIELWQEARMIATFEPEE